jgi:hypothetical protein
VQSGDLLLAVNGRSSSVEQVRLVVTSHKNPSPAGFSAVKTRFLYRFVWAKPISDHPRSCTNVARSLLLCFDNFHKTHSNFCAYDGGMPRQTTFTTLEAPGSSASDSWRSLL